MPTNKKRSPTFFNNKCRRAANINLPPEFVPCLIAYGKFAVKAFLEYPDATGEIQLYEKLLSIRINAGRSMRKAPRLRQSGAVRSKIWS